MLVLESVRSISDFVTYDGFLPTPEASFVLPCMSVSSCAIQTSAQMILRKRIVKKQRTRDSIPSPPLHRLLVAESKSSGCNLTLQSAHSGSAVQRKTASAVAQRAHNLEEQRFLVSCAIRGTFFLC